MTNWAEQFRQRRAAAVVDISFGDAGKGTLVDWLTSPAASLMGPGVVVRFNGGAQAAHNVIRPNGAHHTFSQFGAGSFNGYRTHLSRFMLVEPLSLAAEAEHLASLGITNPLARLSIDRQALLTTPYHAAANQAREVARAAARHGSCGIGVGETMAYELKHGSDAPRVGDCEQPQLLLAKLTRMRDWYAQTLDGKSDGAMYEGDRALRAYFDPAAVAKPADLVEVYRQFAASVRLTDASYLAELTRSGPVVFEGAQGVLLDEWRGFHPYTTWSTTTFANIETLLAESGAGIEPLRIGALRAYTTRHGAGPFPTEDAHLTHELPDVHNGTHRWQGVFRAGHLDLVAHRYALEVAGATDMLALTHLDRVRGRNDIKLAYAYDIGAHKIERLAPGPFMDLSYQTQLTQRLGMAHPRLMDADADWPELVADKLAVPVAITSAGPGTNDKQWRV